MRDLRSHAVERSRQASDLVAPLDRDLLLIEDVALHSLLVGCEAIAVGHVAPALALCARRKLAAQAAVRVQQYLPAIVQKQEADAQLVCFQSEVAADLLRGGAPTGQHAD